MFGRDFLIATRFAVDRDIDGSCFYINPEFLKKNGG
jgi:hypothetical protein